MKKLAKFNPFDLVPFFVWGAAILGIGFWIGVGVHSHWDDLEKYPPFKDRIAFFQEFCIGTGVDLDFKKRLDNTAARDVSMSDIAEAARPGFCGRWYGVGNMILDNYMHNNESAPGFAPSTTVCTTAPNGIDTNCVTTLD